MNKKVKQLFVSLLALLLTMGFFAEPVAALADSPYKTYTVDGYGSVIETQTAYLPYGTINKIGDETLKAPTDFTILSDGTMYILDSGNKRVLVTDIEGNYYGSFGEDIFVNPRGIYVTEDRICYVADRDAKMIWVFDEKGTLIASYDRPTEAMYGETQDFLPLKVVANKSGTIYAICESNTNGIVQISPVDNGTFLGYFGTNATDPSLWRIIWRSILPDSARAKMLGNIPSTPDNMAIDEKGIIYTVTRGEGMDTLKRLNIAGSNMLELENDAYDDVPAAVTTGNHDNVYVVSQQGYIYEYTNEGELLFVFGGSDDGMQRIGLSTKAEAIQVDDNDRIYVLDSDKKQIIIYTPTEFTNHLHEALYLFSKGRYTESKEPLTEVLRMNNLFDYANMAMGKNLFKEENYESSLEYARLAKDYETYSDSFWEIRNVWLKQNLATVFILCIVLFVVVKVIGALDKKKHILDPVRALIDKIRSKKLIKQMGYIFFFMRHPIDGCYGIRKEGRVSVLSANCLLVIGIVEYIINKYFCGFLFKGVREGEYDILSDIGFIVLVLVLVVSCNYLMCTINDGEGKFKHIYCSLIYSFGPYLVIQPALFVLSHVVTENEAFFVRFGNTAMLAWIGVLIFLSIKEINNYSVKETVKIIVLTVFTILIVCLLAFIIYVLSSQVIDFVESIFREVVYKIGN